MFYTCSDLAQCLGRSPRTVRRFARLWSGHPAEQHVRFNRDELEAAIAAFEQCKKPKWNQKEKLHQKEMPIARRRLGTQHIALSGNRHPSRHPNPSFPA